MSQKSQSQHVESSGSIKSKSSKSASLNKEDQIVNVPEKDNGQGDAKASIDGPVMKDEKETQTEQAYENNSRLDEIHSSVQLLAESLK